MKPSTIFSFFSEATNKFYKLKKTATWPLLEISGIKMHLSKSISVKESAQEMVESLHPNGIALDCCTGLGYCAILLAKNSKVKLNIYDIRGKLIQTIADKEFSAGEQHIEFSGEKLSAGVYYCNLKTGEASETKKLLIIK